MKKSMLVVLVIIIAFAAGAIVLLLQDETTQAPEVNDTDQKTPAGTDILELNEEQAPVAYTYIGNSTWEYRIEAQLPDPCHTLQHEITIAESFPEQVTISVYAESPAKDVFCAQVIDTVVAEGDFQASEEASVIVLYVNSEQLSSN